MNLMYSTIVAYLNKSANHRCFLQSDCHLALEIDPVCLSSINEAFIAAQHYLKEPLLSQLRVYLSLVSTADYDLSPEVQQVSCSKLNLSDFFTNNKHYLRKEDGL